MANVLLGVTGSVAAIRTPDLVAALRQAGPEPEVAIVAPGFSCRLQIDHFTGRTAVAPATLLHRLIASGEPEPLS